MCASGCLLLVLVADTSVVDRVGQIGSHPLMSGTAGVSASQQPNSTVNTMAATQLWTWLWPTWLLLAQVMMRQAPQCGYWVMPERPHDIRLENDGYQAASASWLQRSSMDQTYGVAQQIQARTKSRQENTTTCTNTVMQAVRALPVRLRDNKHYRWKSETPIFTYTNNTDINSCAVRHLNPGSPKAHKVT